MFIGPTLGRYFAARFARTVLGVFVTVFALVYTLDFVELRRAGESQGASTGLMAQLSLYRTPAVAEGVLPFAVLFGSMATLLQLSRKLELVVARAAGISAWQFLQPGIFVALALGALAVGVYNPVSGVFE
jgi:lipopolysaccharide export system permease protein